MSSEPINAELRVAFELHRSRVLGLKRNCLTRLLEMLSISPDTTDLEDLDIIRREEWPSYMYGAPTHPIKSSADLYALIDDGTQPPLPEEERQKIFAEIEAILRERATLDTDPLTLPDDFKQLCALTNQIRGPALPKTNSQIPDAFDGLHVMELKYPSSAQDELEDETGLGSLDWEVTVISRMGGMEDAIGGGCWMCWCKNDTDGEDWGWRWATCVGYVNDPEIYEDVKDLLDRYCEVHSDVII